MKQYETTKLFYNKYLYKISFNNSLNSIFRTEFQAKGTLSLARSKIDQLTESYRRGIQMTLPVYRTWKDADEDTYLDARHLYACLIRNKEDYRVRVESFGAISIFSNNLSFLDKIGSGLRASRIEMHCPSEDVESILLNNANTIVSASPVRWPIKITMGKNKRDYSGFANWIRANSDKVKIGDVALESLETHGYVSGYYFFIKSEKILNLVNIMIGDNIRRVEQIIYKGDLDK